MCISRECVRVRTCHASSSLGDDDRLEVSGVAVMDLYLFNRSAFWLRGYQRGMVTMDRRHMDPLEALSRTMVFLLRFCDDSGIDTNGHLVI